MSKIFTSILVLICFVLINMPTGFALEKKKSLPRIEVLSKASMQTLLTESTAPKQNEVLAPLVGEWNFDLTFWRKDGAAPELSTGTAVNRMIFDRLFLSSEMNVVLNIGGQTIPYKSLSYIGYDTDKKVFSSVWLDALHTGMTAGAGQYNKEQKTIEQHGRLSFPLMKEERGYHVDIVFINSDAYRMTFYLNADDGGEYKAVEINFHRKG